jgi:hypothetical protein
VSVVEDLERERVVLRDAFANTEKPLGWYLAGKLSGGKERFEFYKKSAEGGCSWGQVEYGQRFGSGHLVEMDQNVYVEWLEKAVNQNNPKAMFWLGHLFQGKEDGEKKALSYYRASADLGWKISMSRLADMLQEGQGCAKDLRKAVIWGAKTKLGDSFRVIFYDVKQALLQNRTVDCDFHRLCYSVGWGLYWYQYDIGEEGEEFEEQFLDYYCSCVELQQKSIVTFLMFWNQTVGIKDVGAMIAKMVWEEREDNLIKPFEELEP